MEILSLVLSVLFLALIVWGICLLFGIRDYPDLESHAEYVKRQLREEGFHPNPIPDNCIVEMIETLSRNQSPRETVESTVGILRNLLDKRRRFDRGQISAEIIRILRKYEVLDPTES